MLCAAWIAISYESGEIPFESTITFIGLFIAWAFTESKSDTAITVTTLHPHDVELALKLRSLLNESMKRYLREYSFGESFLYDRIDPIRELGRWKGAECEFENSELDNLAAELVRLSGQLDYKIGKYGRPISHRDEFWSLAPHDERLSDWHSKDTTLKIKEVDDLADEIAELADQFEKAFRKLSPKSYIRST